MKTCVIYKSKTGFTKRYAAWIAEELSCDSIDYEKCSQSLIKQYDCIIFGSRIHAGKIDGLKKFKSKYMCNANCRLVVFATGGTPQAQKDVIDSIWRANFSVKELEKVPHFYMQSGLNYEKMGTVDRLLMKTFAKMLSKKADKSPAERGTEQGIGSSYDCSSREQITSLIQYIKEQENRNLN